MNCPEEDSRPIVLKYGGSSVGTPAKLLEVADRVAAARRQDEPLVVVVSAMGKTTNRLLDLARDVTSDPCPRELDVLLSSGERISASLLSMALRERGVNAISLSGGQAGILTDDRHANATVLEVRPDRIRHELARGHVVVVAGYQGTTARGEVATLGRGGSDTSAVAVAAGLDATICHICSDVDGVYTADPRIVPEARRLDEVGYEEMLEMARAGAHVLNPRAVELAQRSDTPILARASFGNGSGTRIHGRTAPAKPGRATSAAGRSDLLYLRAPQGLEGSRRQAVARTLEEADVLFENAGGDVWWAVVATKNVPRPPAFARELRKRFEELEVLDELGSASLIGAGIGPRVEEQRRVEKSLAEAGIGCMLRFASSNACTFVVERRKVPEALRTLHRTFLGDVAPRAQTSAGPKLAAAPAAAG